MLRALLQDEIDMPAEAPAAATALTDAPAEPTEVVEPDAGVAQGPATAAVAQGPATATAAQALGPDAEVEDDVSFLYGTSCTSGRGALGSYSQRCCVCVAVGRFEKQRHPWTSKLIPAIRVLYRCLVLLCLIVEVWEREAFELGLCLSPTTSGLHGILGFLQQCLFYSCWKLLVAGYHESGGGGRESGDMGFFSLARQLKMGLCSYD